MSILLKKAKNLMNTRCNLRLVETSNQSAIKLSKFPIKTPTIDLNLIENVETIASIDVCIPSVSFLHFKKNGEVIDWKNFDLEESTNLKNEFQTCRDKVKNFTDNLLPINSGLFLFENKSYRYPYLNTVPKEVNKQKFEILFQSYLCFGLQNRKILTVPSINLVKNIEFDNTGKPLSRVEIVKQLLQLQNNVTMNEPIDKRFLKYYQLRIPTNLEETFFAEIEPEVKHKQDSMARCYLLATFFMEQLKILQQEQANV